MLAIIITIFYVVGDGVAYSADGTLLESMSNQFSTITLAMQGCYRFLLSRDAKQKSVRFCQLQNPIVRDSSVQQQKSHLVIYVLPS